MRPQNTARGCAKYAIDPIYCNGASNILAGRLEDYVRVRGFENALIMLTFGAKNEKT